MPRTAVRSLADESGAAKSSARTWRHLAREASMVATVVVTAAGVVADAAALAVVALPLEEEGTHTANPQLTHSSMIYISTSSICKCRTVDKSSLHS